MGWYYERRTEGQTISQFFEEKVTFERNGHTSKMLDCAVVSLNTAYIAVETTGPKNEYNRVYALVCQLHHVRNDYHNLGYKDVDEDGGPIEFDCPERILKLLTPPHTDEAKKWREECWRRIERRKKAQPLETGKYLVLDTPIRFANGDEVAVFYIKNARRRIFRSKNGYQAYNLPTNTRLREIGYRVVDDPEKKPPTKAQTDNKPRPQDIQTPLFKLG